MDFLKLQAKNFLTLGDSGALHLANRGLNLLRGQNEDDPSASSNGSGKSSIADALCWALFGKTARGESTDAVVNETTKKDCEVSVSWQDGDTVYTVFRYRKHSQHKNEVFLTFESATGGSGTLTKGTASETDAEIVDRLGCTYEVFVASIYAGQEQMPDLPAMTDKPLKLLIEQASGSQRLERAYEIAGAEAREIDRKLDVAQRDLTHANHLVGIARQEIERAITNSKEFEQKREPQAVAHEATASSIDTEIAALVAKRVVDPATVDKGIADAQQELAGTTAASQAADAYLRSTVAQARRTVMLTEGEIAAQTKVCHQLKAEHDQAQHKVGTPCTACGKAHTDADIAPVRELIRQRLTDQVAQVRTLQARLLTEQAAEQTVLAEHQRLKALVPDVTAVNDRLARFTAAARALQAIETQLALLTRQRDQAKSSAAEVRSAVNPFAKVLEEATVRARETLEKARVAQELVTKVEEERQVAQDILKVYSPAGVRAHILDTVTPYLNARTAEYLSVLSDGNITALWSTLTRNAKGEVKEKFAIDVEHAKGGKKYKLLSGGEKGKVRLACMLALQDLVASRATKPINLWLGDEIDGPLDPNGLERLMAILEKRARERGTVIVVSHRELRDWIDDVTVVSKKGGVSTVEGALTLR